MLSPFHTACHYGAGMFATEQTLKMTDMAIKATKTCSLVGKPVVLDGLSRKEYNGLEGVLGGYVAETERRVFHPLDPDKKEFSVKPENVFTFLQDKEDKVCIFDKSLRPTNLVDVRDRTGSISLHEVTMSKRNDVAKFLLDRSPTSLDVEEYTGVSPRRMALTPVMGSQVNDVIRQYLAKQSRKEVRKENIRKELCENCGKHSCDLGRELLQCTRCLDAVYCSKECQVADWAEKHKKECPKREKQGELVLGEALSIPQGYASTNYSTKAKTTTFQCRAPKGCKPNEKFWIKVQSNGMESDLLIYDESRYCNFKLAPGSLGHKELVEKIATEKAFMGKKSYFRAKFNTEGKCVVFPHTSTMLKW